LVEATGVTPKEFYDIRFEKKATGFIAKKPETKAEKPDRIQQLKQKIYDNLQYLNNKKMPGSQRIKAKNEAKLQVSELLKAGVAARLKLRGGRWDLLIDSETQNKRSLGLVEKAEKVDLAEIKHKDEVSKPFKELELEIRDRQEIIAENFVEPEDLPSGSGQAVLNQGLDDIKKNDGKEITPAAMAVRDAAEIIFNNGKRVIAMAHYPKQELQPEDIWIFIDEKIEEKAIQQLNAEEEASEKERISAEAVIKEADDLEKRLDSADPEERNKAIGEIDQAAENLFGEAEKLGYKKKSVFAGQTSFAELAKAKVPEKGITGEGESEETTPLFQQKTEDKAQEKMFEEGKSFYIRDTLVDKDVLSKLSNEKQVEILRLKDEYDKLHYTDARTEIGPDQSRRMSQKQRDKIASTATKVFEIEDKVKELLKSDIQISKEKAVDRLRELQGRKSQLDRRISDLESIYKAKIESPRDNATKTDYQNTVKELQSVNEEIKTLSQPVSKPSEPVAEQEDVGKKKLLTSLIDITKLKKDKLTTEDIDKVSDLYNQSKDLFTSDQLTEITGFIDKLK